MTDAPPRRSLPDSEVMALIELLFFAYRDFVSDPDAILAGKGFGRAHHRVIHFVGRDPGMTVAQLLDLLRITKQSLSRVLKELIAEGYIYQREGAADRRQRLLHLTDKGEALRHDLLAPQAARVRRAARELGAVGNPAFRDMLLHMISPENRAEVEGWLKRSRKPDGDG
jgi:DNA-binding MarR family transcriptional regulator